MKLFNTYEEAYAYWAPGLPHTARAHLARFDETANGLLHVIQWSQSLGAAQRACGTWIKRGWHDVRVVDAFPVKKTKGSPNSIGSACK